MAKSIAAILAGLPLFLQSAGAAAPDPRHVVLENDHLRLELDPRAGAIARIVDKHRQIHLATIGDLADNFRLVLQTAEKKNHVILGRHQKLTRVSSLGDALELAWNGPLADVDGGRHNLRVTMTSRLSGQSLGFCLAVQNDTAHKLAEAWYPIVSGLAGFGRGQERGETSIMLPTAQPTVKRIALPFGETALHYPAQLNMSYSSVFNTKTNRAMYFASHDTVARLKHYRFFEQSSAAGKDIAACIQHVPFTPPGKTFEGSTVVLRFHDGGPREAGKIYREWFIKAFGLMDPSRSWIRRHSFFQDTMFILPEGTLNHTFNDIPRWAKDARDHGITSVMVSGWHRGGHDNGYPHYEPDPRLGTYDDLKRALHACHKMGVRVYFFVNYQQAMIESDWFKKELNQYVEMREDGGYGACGWGMGTLWARMGHPKPMTWLDPSFPQYREALLRRFLKLVEVGADGLHVDKMFPSPMNFNPRCELGPDTSSWEGAIRLTQELVEKARKINPEFAVSFECNWDRMLTFSNAIWWVGNMSMVRSVFPEMVETRSIASPYDYLGVNNAVRLSQVGLLGPLNYSRSVGWAPWKGLAAYVREVKRIQDSLSEAVFFGEVLEHSQVQLAHEPEPGVEYNVFRGLKTGKRVCILTNSGMTDQDQVIRGFAGNDGGSARIHVPFAPPRDASLPVKVTVPAERIAFVEEVSVSPSKLTAEIQSPRDSVGRIGNPSYRGAIENGGFESGDFTGWTADPNWRVDQNSIGAYSGWQGKFFAFSGAQGEAATGRLKSKSFVLDNDAVRLLIAGWNRPWNYVTLNTADGKQLDRQSPTNSLTFAPVLLDGSGHKGKPVYVEAVDNGDQSGFSMFCIDDVRTIPHPYGRARPLAPLPEFDVRKSIKLENDRYRVEVSRTSGAITRILDKPGTLDLIREPRLAGNFKFTLPLPGKEPWETIEANYILGNDQPLSSFDSRDRVARPEALRRAWSVGEAKGSGVFFHVGGRRSPTTTALNADMEKDSRPPNASAPIEDSGRATQMAKLALVWQGPLKSRTGEKYDVGAAMGIELDAEAVRFTLRIDNRSPYKIGEVFFPILGGVTGLGDTSRDLKATRLVRPAATGIASSDVFFTFANFSDLGDQGAEQFYLYPKDWTEPWMCFFSPKHRRSIYLGAHDPTDRSKVLHLELQPGHAQTPRGDGNWPRPEELGGLPAGVLVSVVDFANHPAGKTYEAAPVVLRAHDGDWQEGQQIYRKWKNR